MTELVAFYLTLAGIGLCALPLAGRLFARFPDRGYLFARPLGLLLAGWCMWTLSAVRLAPFRRLPCLLCALLPLCAAMLAVLSGRVCARRRHAAEAQMLVSHTAAIRSKEGRARPAVPLRLILAEELLFALLFFAAVWVIGFKPEAYGTEKFMDYGLITSILRCDYMPPADSWLAGETVNYYCGGQFLCAFLIRLSGISAGVGYTCVRTAVWSASFVLPFSLGLALMTMHDRHTGQARPRAALLAGLLSGLGAAFAGNGHFLFIGLPKILRAALTGTASAYWFPDSTRFIGYFPETADKTIHEFPAYASVLGDLHAHYLDLPFFLTALALAVAYACNRRGLPARRAGSLLSRICAPEVLLVAFFTGLFRWTNYWDLPIAFTVCGLVILAANLREMKRAPLFFFAVTASQAAFVLLAGAAAALPFTAFFAMISSEVLPVTRHSALWQLAILWGAPLLICAMFALFLLRRRRASAADRIIGLFALCGAGLILLPELICVKDIYGETYQRANTMFKLTWQAFTLLAIACGYIAVRFLTEKRRLLRAAGALAACVIALSSAFTPVAVSAWFGDVTDASARTGADAAVFPAKYYPSDTEAVTWLIREADARQANGEAAPVILEAAGESYSRAGRISVATGCPTVIGWFTHEWLWRDSADVPAARSDDVRAIYTAKDQQDALALLEKYDVAYIYIGELEEETYPEMDRALLESLGEVIAFDGAEIIALSAD